MSTQKIHCLLKQTLPFSGLSTAQRENIASDFSIQKYTCDEVILSPDQLEHAHLYVVVTGHVRIVDKTTRKLARIISSYKLFGHYGLLRGSDLPYQVEAVDDVELALLHADVFNYLYQTHSRFAAFFESDLRVYERDKLTLYDVSGSQFLFGTRLRDLIQSQPVLCDVNVTVEFAAGVMNDQNTDYVVVTQNDKPVGILTDKILRSDVVAKGRSLQTPVHIFMSEKLHFMTQKGSLFEALFLMLKKGASHVLVKDDATSALEGVIGSSDIARGQGYNPSLLIDQIAQIQSMEHLRVVRHEANLLLVQLYRRGVGSKSLITINTIINDTITGRVLELSTDALSHHVPDANFNWVWLSLGSEGRGEMSLKTDQDNALVYSLPDHNDSELLQRWLASWTTHVNQSLNDIGLNLCDGGMMACNPAWRINIQNWRRQVDEWLNHSQAQQIMQTSAACDLRAVHGNIDEQERIKSQLIAAIKAHPRFLKHMAVAVISNRPPVNALTGRIRTLKTAEGQKINLKRSGIQPITEFARILSLQAGYLESSNTFDRLEYLRQTQPKIDSDISDALDSYSHLNDIRLGHHLQAVSTGMQPDNLIAINELSDTQYQMLKAAFRSIRSIQATLAHRFNLM